MTDWIEERISEDKHFFIIGDFECGPDDPLNTFLSDKAIGYDEEKLGYTYLILDGPEVLAYYTIKVNGVQICNEETREYEAIPMIEIARIAVSFPLQGHGFGKRIFHDYIMPKVNAVSEIVAVQGIMVFVEPDNKQGIAFYESVGFKRAGEIVQKSIGESFNEKCDLYMLRVDAAQQ